LKAHCAKHEYLCAECGQKFQYKVMREIIIRYYEINLFELLLRYRLVTEYTLEHISPKKHGRINAHFLVVEDALCEGKVNV